MRLTCFYKNNNYKLVIAGLALSLAYSPFNCLIALSLAFTILFSFFEEDRKNKPDIDVKNREGPGISQKSHYKEGLLIGFIVSFAHFLSSLFWIAHSLTIDITAYWWLIPITIICIPACFAVFMSLAIMFSYIYFKQNLTKQYSFSYPSSLPLKKNKLKRKYISQSLTWLLGPFSKKESSVSLRISTLLIFASFWSIMEIVRSYLILPFPWLFLGYTVVNYPSFMLLAPIIGAHGIGLGLIIFSGIFFIKDRAFTLFVLISIGILYIWSGLDSHSNFSKHNNVNIPVSIIQPNSSQLVMADEQTRYDILRKTYEMSQEATGKIIVWPESGIPFLLPKDIKTIPILNDLFSQDTILISGADLFVYNNPEKTDISFYNAMLDIREGAEIRAAYHKVILVPFGEYIPWRTILGTLSSVVLPYSDFQAGIKAQPNFSYVYSNQNKLISINIAPYICYEIAFSPFIFSNIHNSTNLIVNITNDGWFGNTIGPYQHLAITQMRAAEYGLSIVRAANTGISAVIDSHGKILQQTNLGTSNIVNTLVEVPVLPRYTPYRIYSFYIILFTIISTIIVGLRLKNLNRLCYTKTINS